VVDEEEKQLWLLRICLSEIYIGEEQIAVVDS